MKVYKTFDWTFKNFNDEERTFEAIASTETPDRHGDIIKQDGWVLDSFLKNPVLLWGHDYHSPPIGKVIDIRVEDNKLVFKAKFPEEGVYELSDTIYRLFKEGILKAFSVGFIPLEWEEKKDGGYIFKKQELLEISAVTVPANPEALVASIKAMEDWKNQMAMNEKNLEGDLDKVEYTEVDKKIAMNLKNEIMRTLLKAVNEEVIEGEETKNAVAVHDGDKLDDSSAWDKVKAIKQLRKWASTDGSGDKDKIVWRKYRMGFAFYDPENEESFGGYKLPHHYVDGDQLVTVWSGVRAAMAALMGARGGVNIPDDDVPGVYKHLAHHYRQFDKEPPDLKTILMIREVMKHVYRELDIVNEKIALIDENEFANNEELKAVSDKLEVFEDVIKRLTDRLSATEELVEILQNQFKNFIKDFIKSEVIKILKEVDYNGKA